MLNKTMLMGRLTKDAELRMTQNGVAVASFTLAVDRRFAKEGQQQTDFINCVAFRNTAEFIAKHFTKGRMICVAGSLQSRTWEGQDGKKNYVTEVMVEEAHFTGEKRESPAEEFAPIEVADEDKLPW